MLAVTTLLITIALTLLVTRIATVALVHTGLSRDSARFQARSALTGVGFTTEESESVANHPVRRRIVMWLMLLGNAGIVTVIATLMVSLSYAKESGTWAAKLSLMGGGLALIWILASSQWIDRHLSAIISWALRRFTTLDLSDYTALLNLADGYAVSELFVEPGDWLADKTLAELSLPSEGVLVLGVRSPDGKYRGSPTGAAIVHEGDVLVVYGPVRRLEELDKRRADHAGQQAHEKAKTEQMVAES